MKTSVCVALLVVALCAGAQPDIAVNVDGFADWMSSRAYIDASAMFRRWGMAGKGWEENPNLKLTADNYPLADADAVLLLRGDPAGVYQVRVGGKAAGDFCGVGLVLLG